MLRGCSSRSTGQAQGEAVFKMSALPLTTTQGSGSVVTSRRGGGTRVLFADRKTSMEKESPLSLKGQVSDCRDQRGCYYSMQSGFF